MAKLELEELQSYAMNSKHGRKEDKYASSNLQKIRKHCRQRENSERDRDKWSYSCRPGALVVVVDDKKVSTDSRLNLNNVMMTRRFPTGTWFYNLNSEDSFRHGDAGDTSESDLELNPRPETEGISGSQLQTDSN